MERDGPRNSHADLRLPGRERAAEDGAAGRHYRGGVQHGEALYGGGFAGDGQAIEKSVSRATVYRTLPLLVECGVLREMDFGKDQKYYDPNFNQHPHHNHLICVDCDRIVEFEDRNIETLENCITKRLGFSPASKIVRIEATCDQLKLKGVCKNRPKTG